jgi:hypothetical protein
MLASFATRRGMLYCGLCAMAALAAAIAIFTALSA